MNTTQTLTRSLGLGYVVVVTVANILGSGVYKKVAPMANELGSPGWVLIAWVIGGVITLFGALSYAEVSGLLADTGGDYAYYKKIYNRFLAFMFGWTLFAIVQTAAISSLAYVFSQSLQSIIDLPPILTSLSDVSIAGVFFPFADLSTKLVAVVLIVALTLVNLNSIKSGAGLSNILLWLIYIGLGIIIIFGLTSKQADFSNTFTLATVDNSTVTISSLFTAMLGAFWAYQGWTSVGYIGGEVKNANNNIPRGIAIGVFIVIGIYLLVNLTYLALLPIENLKEIHAAGNKVAAIEAVKVFWGERGVIFISILILITTLGCTHATIYSSARPYYAMAKEGLFFKYIGKLNSNHVPSNSLWLQCIWACVLVFSGTFDQLTDMVIFSIFIFYGLTSFSVFILRKRMPDAHRPYKVWGYPFVPAIMVLFSIGLFFNTVITQPREAIFGMVLILTGVPLYLWFKSRP
jgi:APA family basic amino acid/polyamine antiporter